MLPRVTSMVDPIALLLDGTTSLGPLSGGGVLDTAALLPSLPIGPGSGSLPALPGLLPGGLPSMLGALPGGGVHQLAGSDLRAALPPGGPRPPADSSSLLGPSSVGGPSGASASAPAPGPQTPAPAPAPYGLPGLSGAASSSLLLGGGLLALIAIFFLKAPGLGRRIRAPAVMWRPLGFASPLELPG